MVEDEVYERDPVIHIGFKIDVASKDALVTPKSVTIPTDILHDLLYVARTVANSDGDIRGLESTARDALADFNEHFLTPVLGPDPWAAAAREREEEEA